MGEIVDISDIKPHRSSEVICVMCGMRWVAIRPEGTLLKTLHCENCGPGYVIETGELIFSGCLDE
jgi:hypothetical protein